MKTLFIVLFSFLVAQSVFAQVNGIPEGKKSAVVDNLTIGIKSDNAGLKSSSALVMYDLINESYLKSSDAYKAMIPLLEMLHNGKTDEERIAAALALFELGNPIGIYRLRGVGEFDSNERVASICKNLYVSYHKLHGTEYLTRL
jgi:hypothetical protein